MSIYIKVSYALNTLYYL